MSKYAGRFKAIEKKLPREDTGNFYSFNDESDGTYTDDCGNSYTEEEFEALTCNKMIFNWTSSKDEEKDERLAGINARQRTQNRRLKYLYDAERKRYGLKPPFASAKPEDIPPDCGPGWKDEPLTENASGEQNEPDGGCSPPVPPATARGQNNRLGRCLTPVGFL